MKRLDPDWILAFSLSIFASLILTESVKVQMRIVRETANYGYFGHNLGDVENHDQLVAKVPPANFSGPAHLQNLFGKCYNVTLERYRYVLCPFQNITQYEVSQRWNAYQGILGIWSHWTIENNTFSNMVFTHGDRCGDTDRSVEVSLHCGPKEELTNVTEPKQCQYAARFITKLVCHKDSLLVYPRLNTKQQEQWDYLWTEFHHGYLTEELYQDKLQELLQEAGLTKQIDAVQSKEASVPIDANGPSNNTFSDLNTCNKEYGNLKKEVVQLIQEMDSLRLMLDLSKVRNRTVNKPLAKTNEGVSKI